MNTKSPALALSTSVLLGASIWFFSECLTGHREPWDAQGGIYPLLLVIAGFLPACLTPGGFWRWATGVFVGQLTAFMVMSVQQPGALWPVGIGFLAAYSLWGLLGATLGAALGRKLSKL
jgi:hypothetical protein